MNIQEARDHIRSLLTDHLPPRPQPHRTQQRHLVADANDMPTEHAELAASWWESRGIDEVRRLEGEGRWLRFDGRRWLYDGNTQHGLNVSVQQHITSLYDHCRAQVQATSGSEATAWRDIAKIYASNDFATKSISYASRTPQLAVSADFFDPADSNYLLTTLNGTLDLRSRTLTPHDAQHRLTGLAPVDFDPHATHDEWSAFITKIIPDDEVRAYVQRVAGMALVGDPGTQMALVISGSGGNGKGVFMRTLSGVLGRDYATVVPRSVLQAGKREEHPTQLMELRGRRLALLDEFPPGGKFNTELFKEITGGGELKARSMRQDFVQFRPTHTLFVTTNFLPEVSATDMAMWRRLRHVVFPYSVPANEVDDTMESRILRNESSGILNWLLAGFTDYYNGGLREPQQVTDDTMAWRHDQDHLLMYAAECLESAEGNYLASSDLMQSYTGWCAKNDISQWDRYTTHTLSPEMEKRGFVISRNKRHGDRVGTWLLGNRVRVDESSGNVVAFRGQAKQAF